MTYEELRIKSNCGWNTWYSPAMTAHVLLPYGFGINLCFSDYANGSVMRNLKVGDQKLRPGKRSWDGTYINLTFESESAGYTVESTVDNGDQIILVTPDVKGRRAPVLIAEACIFWGKDGTLSKNGKTIAADFADGKHIEIFTTGKDAHYPFSGSTCPFLTAVLDEPVVVSTRPCTVSEARALLDRGHDAVSADEASKGKNAKAYQAMKSCLAWDTIYEPEHDRVCSPVSRSWSEGWGGYVLFDWDTFFASLMCGYCSKELAYLNAFAITNEMTEDGFVPNFGTVSDCKSRDRSQPPVGTMIVKELYDWFGDDWFVKEIWPAMYRWNTWFWNNRRLPDHTFCWGSNAFSYKNGRWFEVHDTHNLQGAKFESGLDNSPMYDDAVFDPESNLMLLSDVGLTGLFIKDCRCLIDLAETAGHPEAIPVLKERLNETEAAMQKLWNPETGIFENLDAVTGKFSHRISPTNFYSMFSHNVTDEQKKSMIERYLYDPDELGGEFVLPSISRRDPAYKDQDYWRGRIWAPMNFLVYEALSEAGMEEAEQFVADSSEALLLKEWNEHGHVHENYNGDTGWGCDKPNSNNFYHWGGLLGHIAIVHEKKHNSDT
ncbi:MAG: hypothetical protein MJ175_07195 [Clostridia bacterium]|nr:hypothetical protein [Clostridia bacterium]